MESEAPRRHGRRAAFLQFFRLPFWGKSVFMQEFSILFVFDARKY